MPTISRIPYFEGFDFARTIEVLRRGPHDPLHWSDGQRWRRLFAVDGRLTLVEATCGRTVTVRRLAGRVPNETVRRLVQRVLGLDDPGPGHLRGLPPSVRRAARAHLGVSLPGHATLFEALVQTVLGQQIHAKVANRHRAAFIYAFGARYEYRGRGYWAYPTPERLARARISQIRALGISTVKARAIVAIAASLRDGRLSEDALARMSAEDAIAALSALPGIGRWTSEWVLLRGFRRFEIVPAGDLAIRKAVGWSLGRTRLLTERQVRAAVRGWAPYAGLVAYRTLHAHRQTVA